MNSNYSSINLQSSSGNSLSDYLNFNNNKVIETFSSNELTSKYDNLINDLNSYKASEGQMYSSNHLGSAATSSNISLEKLRNINDNDQRREIIWKYLLSTYEMNKMITSSSQSALEKSYNVNKTHDNMKNTLEEDMKKINNENSTLKSLTQNNEYEYRKMVHEVSVFKICIIILWVNGILFTVFRNAGWYPLSGRGALTCWSIVMFCLAIYVVYELFYKNINRDERKYDERNFPKPSDKVVLQSKENAGLEVQSKFGKLDFDPSTIDIGSINKYINEEGTCQTDEPEPEPETS